ncbi:23S rRNA (adenine(1618)-N(6))-methyltransferase RlmF [Methylotenera mobilis]|uniref:Ribosomal RNA large subunit methyltransferase F n=1 Tax=Methylotenera mobilis (strain JLW8 / ATCC BAA-1282 / DSM 17540) TaxID=583345 RepID=C6WYB0_METML|nr:23S rRNA (adenine(1618)-N(6))-methyltransferase RlmF [Methylotenera mobilis]ACT48829.1 rRNA (adenine-N(6)-)-methyltransferase [Methylotenera mobilis JLW8]
MKPENTKSALHPRNRHRERYDFEALIQTSAALAPYVKLNAYGDASVDFADAQSVKALNQALLKQFYAVDAWDIPKHYLCPPIPGRADYLHYLADLLSEAHGKVPRGSSVRVLDIGVGANMIYPLIGTREYGWRFVGADIDAKALGNAQQIIDANALGDVIELRLQARPASIFKGMIQPDELFALTMCNPPFHGSLAEAQAGTQRKWRGLGKHVAKPSGNKHAALNFGGQGAELYCAGGEEGFLTAMVKESQQYAAQCVWFTSLVSKATNLPSLYRALNSVQAREVKTIAMTQGQKQSRIVAWTFLDVNQRRAVLA